jgi:hypothetical protein
MESIDSILRRISASQAGTFTIEQAASAGIHRAAVHRRERRSAILCLHPRTYFGGHIATTQARRWAAVLSAGPDSLITGEAALDDWGVGRHPSDIVEIVVTRRQRPLAGVTMLHSTTLHAEDRSSVSGRPTTTVERALVDVAGRRSTRQLCQLLREASFRGLLDVSRLRRTIDRNRNRRGIGRLRRALSLHLHGHGGTDSGYEDRFVRMLDRAGIHDAATNVVLSVHGADLRVDVYVPHLGLGIEVDPDGHLEPPMAREDRLRSALYESVGLSHIRVPGSRLRSGVREVMRRHREWNECGRPPAPTLMDTARLVLHERDGK